MTRFVVLGEEKKNSQDHTLKLRLESQEDGSVHLYATDQEDLDWNILRLTSDGFLMLAACIEPNIGLELDKDGRICVANHSSY